MKIIIIILFIFLRLTTIGQINSNYLITGVSVNNIDVSDKIFTNNSTIEIRSNAASLTIFNKKNQTYYVGFLGDDNVPDRKIEKTLTTYESWLMFRKITYGLYHENNTSMDDGKNENGRVNIILVFKPKITELTLTFVLNDNVTMVFKGYEISQ